MFGGAEVELDVKRDDGKGNGKEERKKKSQYQALARIRRMHTRVAARRSTVLP